MTTRLADTVVRIGLPADPAFVPVVETIIPISSQPSQILRLQRPPSTGGPDLLAVTAVATYQTSTTAGKLVLIDGMLGRVVGQVDRLGDTPFAIAQFPPRAGEKSARLAITLFGGCSVALVDVPYDRPGDASLRANLGSCPP
jgi:outer membrane receptor protein involved in Fe transport